MSRGPNQSSHPSVVKQQYDNYNVWNFENQWRADLFACKPCGRCCGACICPCIIGCKLAKALGESSIIGCCPGSLSYFRTKLRTARRIEGSCCGDYWASACCGACVATQLSNELESQGLWDTKGKQRKTYPRNDRSQNNGDY
ncbi:unnamed protein product [Adineta steineri]|uniref:PLAC8-domain-containing protein n=1 Tax=Adineta steineri TaxID=433720 RepID=A0A818TAF2_9BILA|nr:unnamed protein product [Adineta steineri]